MSWLDAVKAFLADVPGRDLFVDDDGTFHLLKGDGSDVILSRDDVKDLLKGRGFLTGPI